MAAGLMLSQVDAEITKLLAPIKAQLATFALATDVTALANRVKAVEAQLATLAGQPAAVADLTAKVTALRADVDALKAVPQPTPIPDPLPPIDPIPVDPPVVAPVTGARMQIEEGSGKGPTWIYANEALQWSWTTLGGDWLPGVRSTFMVEDATKPVVFDVAAIVKSGRTEGFLVHTVSGGAPKFWTRISANPPTLSVVTDQGTFACPCITNCFIDPSAGHTINGDDGNGNQTVGLFQFDLSAIKGTIQSATFTLTLRRYGLGATLACECLDMPVIISDPATQLGNVKQGLAATVANDRDLAANPAILFYSECTDEAAIKAAWSVAGPGLPDHVCINPKFVPMPEVGLTALRMESQSPANHTDNSSILTWRKYAGGKMAGAIAGTYKELYCRYLLRIDPDVYLGMTEAGVKLPGFEADGNVQPPSDWSYRMEHGSQSVANPYLHRLWIYSYDVLNPLNSPTRGKSRFTSACLKAGQLYSIEPHIKLNTVSTVAGALVANPDGVIEIFVDGALVYSDYKAQITYKPESGITNIPFANFFHGGTGLPSASIHYEFSGIATSQQYIGPPKRGIVAQEQPPVVTPGTPQPDGSILLPFAAGDAWWNALPLNQVVEVPNTSLDKLPMPAGFVDYGSGKLSTVMASWSGAAFDPVLGDFYDEGAGHTDGSNNGLFKFALEAMGWSMAMAPTIITPEMLAAAKAAWNATTGWISFSNGIDASGKPADVWPDGKPTCEHTYLDLVWTGTEVLRGGIGHVWHYKGGVPSPSKDTINYISDVLSFWDAQNKVMVRCKSLANDYWDVRTYDPATRVHTPRPGALNISPTSVYCWVHGSADLIGREIVMTDGIIAFALNVDTWKSRKIVVGNPLANEGPINPTNQQPLTLRGGAGSSRGLEFIGKLSGKVYVMDAAGKITQPALTGVFAPPALTTQNGVYGRFRRYLRGSVEVLALLPSTSANVRLVRIA